MNSNVSRSDFYYDIADHMLTQVKRSRRSSAFHSPDLKQTPLEVMTSSGDIIGNIVNASSGHKSRHTRNPGFDSAEKPNLRGASGKLKACVVCTNKVSRKVWSHDSRVGKNVLTENNCNQLTDNALFCTIMKDNNCF